MKISALCIISLGLSLAVFSSDAARAKEHHDNKHVDHHHHQAPKDHSHHNKHANDHHHHNKQAADHSHHNKKQNKKQKTDHSHHSKHQADRSHHNKHVDHSHHLKANAIPSKPYKGSHRHDKEKKKEPVRDISQDSALIDRRPPGDAVVATPVAPPRQEQPAIVAPSPSINRKDKMVVAYWTDWTSGAMPPESIPFDKVTHINYAFSVVGSDYRPVFQTDYLLNRVVYSAHLKGVKVLMSIGGWTGSQYFSPLSASPRGRQTFVKGAIDFIKNHNLDGIDIDWEYPGRMGSACNIFDPNNDAKNFLLLLQELRAAMNQLPNGDRLEISLATRLLPFDGPEGQMKDVSEFAKVVNHINVMAYDINGSWGSVTGPNAPLGGSGDLTYVGGAQAWIDAGFPPAQINMGVPFYGRSLTTQSDMTNSQSMAAPFFKAVPLGDSNDALWTDPCEHEAAYSGVWKYKNLREQGLIDQYGNARAPWIRKFDRESQTPWLFNPATKQFISYDDKESLKLKVDYAKQKQLGGVMLWAINQDTADFELLEVLQDVRRQPSTLTSSTPATTAMSLIRTLARPATTLVPRSKGTTGTPAAATAVALLDLSSLLRRDYSSATASAVVSESSSFHNKTPLYTFQDMSEQEVLFVEMRHHKMSWGSIGKHFGKSGLEVFYGYIPVATRAIKHQWTSRMTEQDVLRYMEESNKP
ncbi:hypothetical protein EC991_000086 [Linnemannia zychae]|nr:hypothetical protein EC991_000086 [Linnemannia zychae]